MHLRIIFDSNLYRSVFCFEVWNHILQLLVCLKQSSGCLTKSNGNHFYLL